MINPKHSGVLQPVVPGCDTTANPCHADIETYTDDGQCSALVSLGLEINIDTTRLKTLKWQITGATRASSGNNGFNLLKSYVFQEGTSVVTYMGENRDGHLFACSFKVLVMDNEAPAVLDSVSDIFVSAEEQDCGAFVTWPVPKVKDNCTPSSEILYRAFPPPGSWFPVGKTKVVYSISDGFVYNDVMDSFFVYVEDHEKPQLAIPSTKVECTEEVPKPFSSLQQFVDAGGSVFDNCELDSGSFCLVKSVSIRSSHLTTFQRWYRVTDAAGNGASVLHSLRQENKLVILKSGMAACTAIISGNWNDPSIWSCGTVPGSGDDVIIPAGMVVTVDAAAACRKLEIQSGGTLDHGTNLATTLQVYGDWINDGSYAGGTNGVVEFVGNEPASISGDTDFEGLVFNKTSGLLTPVVISGNVNVLSSGELRMIAGLVRISLGGSMGIFPSQRLDIEEGAGFDVVGGYLNTGRFSIRNEGLIRIASGSVVNFGTSSGNEVHMQVDGSFIVTGGTVNIAGRLYNSASGILNPLGVNAGITISGGTITLCTEGNGASNVGALQVTSSGNFLFSGGRVVFQNPSTASTEIDLGLLAGTGTKNIDGGTFQFGNEWSPPDARFVLNSRVPLDSLVLKRSVELAADLLLSGAVRSEGGGIVLNDYSIYYALSSPGSYSFPLENEAGSLIPLNIDFTEGVFSDSAMLQVASFAVKHPQNTNVNNFLRRYWLVQIDGVDQPNYDLSVQYADEDIQGMERFIELGQWRGSLPWQGYNAADTTTNTIGAEELTDTVFEFTGISSRPPHINLVASDSSICRGEVVDFLVETTGDSPWNFEWFNQAGDLIAVGIDRLQISPTVTSIYRVKGTDGNGVVSADSLEIFVYPMPEVELVPPVQTLCPNADFTIRIQGNLSGITYNWHRDYNDLLEGLENGSGDLISGTLSSSEPASMISTYYHVYAQMGECIREVQAQVNVGDTIPPVFEAPDFTACVDPLHWAVYNPANPSPVANHVDSLVQKAPVDYYTLEAGSRALDLVALSDNCCDSTEMQISWRIDFSPTPDPHSGVLLAHPSISGTGQPSEYRDPINGSFTDIYLWGDGVTFQPVLHTITYWVTDCNGNVAPVVVKTITITPRPQIVKVY